MDQHMNFCSEEDVSQCDLEAYKKEDEEVHTEHYENLLTIL